MRRAIWPLCFLILFCAGTGLSHETFDTGDGKTGAIGIEEKTGQLLPTDLVFRDETGAYIKMGDLLGKPVILTLVYYSCEHICPLMLGGLAQALPRLTLTAGNDYRVLTVSFDETDTPDMARNTRKNYIAAAGSSFPASGWHFLTGNRENISRLTQSVGFTFRKEIHGFNHPVVLIFLSPQGKISKYLQVTKYDYGAEYPIAFSTFDLTAALTEAAQGRTVTGFRRALLYCFAHEPPGQSNFFRFIAVIGLVSILALVGFFIYLQISTRKYRRGKEYDLER